MNNKKNSKIKVIALDLEGTLISNAVSQFPRPYLYEFLEFLRENFERIVLFTAVSQTRVKDIINNLLESRDIPEWFKTDVDYIIWTGIYKNLNYIPNIKLGEVLLLDDQEAYILPEQKEYWVLVPEFEYPYCDTDNTLKLIIQSLKENYA